MPRSREGPHNPFCSVAGNLYVWTVCCSWIALGYGEADRSCRFVRDVSLTTYLDCSQPHRTIGAKSGTFLATSCLLVSEALGFDRC